MPPFCWPQQNASPTILRTSAKCYHVHETTKMMLTIFARSRTWSARHALPSSCSSVRYPLPLPTQTQNGSQGRFCAKEGHMKNGRLPAIGGTVAITKHKLTHSLCCAIIQAEPSGSRQEGIRWRLAFTPPIQREVMVVTDYEILAIVLMIITVAFTIHIGNHKQ